MENLIKIEATKENKENINTLYKKIRDNDDKFKSIENILETITKQDIKVNECINKLIELKSELNFKILFEIWKLEKDEKRK